MWPLYSGVPGGGMFPEARSHFSEQTAEPENTRWGRPKSTPVPQGATPKGIPPWKAQSADATSSLLPPPPPPTRASADAAASWTSAARRPAADHEPAPWTRRRRNRSSADAEERPPTDMNHGDSAPSTERRLTKLKAQFSDRSPTPEKPSQAHSENAVLQQPPPQSTAAPEQQSKDSTKSQQPTPESSDLREASHSTVQESSSEFRAGEKVRYWSATHAKWVEAHVQRVNRNASGSIASYDLTARAQAELSRVRHITTPEDAPGPASAVASAVAPSLPPEPVVQVPVNFNVHDKVHYFSETKSRWIPAVIEAKYEKEGCVTYDLACKKGVPPDRLRQPDVEYKVNEQVEYWSVSLNRWILAQVQALRPDGTHCDLDIKPGAAFDRMRKANFDGTIGVVSHSAAFPPPPLACSFKTGDQVQYFSDTKQRWIPTVVQRCYDLEGNIVYDLDCKKGASAEKVRASPLAQTQMFEVNEEVEYWSMSSGRWIPAQVLAVRPHEGTCDLDVKQQAVLGRIRRPVQALSVNDADGNQQPLQQQTSEGQPSGASQQNPEQLNESSDAQLVAAESSVPRDTEQRPISSEASIELSSEPRSKAPPASRPLSLSPNRALRALLELQPDEESAEQKPQKESEKQRPSVILQPRSASASRRASRSPAEERHGERESSQPKRRRHDDRPDNGVGEAGPVNGAPKVVLRGASAKAGARPPDDRADSWLGAADSFQSKRDAVGVVTSGSLTAEDVLDDPMWAELEKDQAEAMETSPPRLVERPPSASPVRARQGFSSPHSQRPERRPSRRRSRSRRSRSRRGRRHSRSRSRRFKLRPRSRSADRGRRRY